VSFALSLVLVVVLQQALAPAPVPAGPTPAVGAKAPLPAARLQALETQVMLDRAGFSPGAIDGRPGDNTRRALEAFTRQGGAAQAAGALTT
jgi:peptidoglycan hydrolase-like protein with peptidoglycan-binding domain